MHDEAERVLANGLIKLVDQINSTKSGFLEVLEKCSYLKDITEDVIY